MMMALILDEPAMLRRTITIPDYLDAEIRKVADEGESFSATVTRLLERAILRPDEERPVPEYVGAWEGPGDLSLRVEEILEQLARDPDS